MPIPTGRPNNVINAMRKGFHGRKVWPKARFDPDAHYQRLGVMYGYLYETPQGFKRTDLGDQESGQA